MLDRYFLAMWGSCQTGSPDCKISARGGRANATCSCRQNSLDHYTIPASPQRGLILVITYAVVVSSILVQGLTVGKLARWVSETTYQRPR